jgi:hypothetical protein
MASVAKGSFENTDSRNYKEITPNISSMAYIYDIWQKALLLLSIPTLVTV